MSRLPFRARLGVTHKLWLSVVAMVIAVLLPVGSPSTGGSRPSTTNRTPPICCGSGTVLRSFLARAPAQGASEAVRAIAEITGTPLLVLNRDGVTVAGSGDLAAEVGKRPQNPRILSALRGEAGVFLAVDETLPGSLFVTSVPIRSGAEITGAVVLFRPADNVRRAIARVRTLLATAAAGLFLLLAAFGWLLSRRLVSPLIAMKDATDHMARGEYATRVESPGGDELGELAEAINRLGASLHDLEASRRRFFANISHELRTPLSYLQGYSDALAEGLAASPDDVKEYGRILSDEARRLSRLVDDLFVLAQAEEGRLSLHLVDIDVGRVIGRVLERVRPKAEEKGVEIEASVSEGARAIADPDRLEQILLNLLDNAVRHTPSGGRVRLSTTLARGAAEAAGQGAAYQGDSPSSGSPDHLAVVIDDSGPGLEGDPLKVWERFYRGDQSRNRDLGGAGLGLAIVRGLVEAQGGRVWAEARGPLGGARFAFSLRTPRAATPSGASGAAPRD